MVRDEPITISVCPKSAISPFVVGSFVENAAISREFPTKMEKITGHTAEVNPTWRLIGS